MTDDTIVFCFHVGCITVTLCYLIIWNTLLDNAVDIIWFNSKF